ncbi:MAG: Gfo/Idh/MocA family oxidoreductase [Lentisphaeria bacterium]|nr:Gfo/Idh/MocA family oxidoreductase [Lentisphaeria bacterium]
MEKKKFKIAIIGCGARSVPYAMTLANHEEVELVACADPDINHLRTMLSFTSVKEEDIRIYSDWKDLCDNEKDLDGAVIATPNYLHHQPAAEIMKRGIPLALEKPLTTTMKDSEFLLDIVREYRPQLLIGFVLRSTPFYHKVREIIDSGRLGRIVSIQADELVTPGISSVISRSPWRRFTALSGGTMMEKCSHDMDLINYFAGGRPVAINSFGGSMIFRPNPSLPQECLNCQLKDSCLYYKEPPFSEAAGDAHLQKTLHDEMDRCIYNIDKDVADNQVVSILYSNGVLANFTLAFNCHGERAGRNLHIIGTAGRLWGSIDQNQIGVCDTATGKTQIIDIPVVNSGHNGGDTRHALELLKMMKDRTYRPNQDAYAGYLSNALCIASDISAAEARQLHLEYDSNGFIQFV